MSTQLPPEENLDLSSSARGISPVEIGDNWHLIEPLLKRVLRYNQRYNIETLRARLLSGNAQLFVCGNYELITVTEIVIYPRSKVLNIFMVAGKNIDKWLIYLPAIEAWAKSEGCNEIEESGRHGWIRKLTKCGYYVKDITMCKEVL